ncbi:MAG: hypothetical protein P0Y53_19645 [Candidatus Pseudobacter hemicellulosilyticus]|uniref:Uncharacterized protein n=1 Tax=Candidatus Pseudobacter hemicellulosilyticus TaxID=3121375 RepID=A0AAJ5WMK7_9BACT|nr:MAG: hypothetical protein P0Y53_19645 [Pseudobacter sp.]
MKKQSLFFSGLLLVATVQFFPGCHKLSELDDIFGRNDRDQQRCRITQISDSTELMPGHPATGVFSYNKQGNPVSVLFDNKARTQYLFWYDNRQRITDFFTAYIDENGVWNSNLSWRQYTYDAHNRVVRDSGWSFATVVDNVPQRNEQMLTASDYEYDAKGRIARWTHYVLANVNNPDTVSEVYTYNAQGNLTRIQNYEKDRLVFERTYGPYTNKPSIHSMHKVWMFLNRNYSVNSLYEAAEYTRFNLPTGYQLPSGTNQYSILPGFPINRSAITYQCK